MEATIRVPPGSKFLETRRGPKGQKVHVYHNARLNVWYFIEGVKKNGKPMWRIDALHDSEFSDCGECG